MNKKKAIYIIVGAYIAISAIFISIILWNTFTNYYSSSAFQEGQKTTIDQLIEVAEDPSCQTIPVYSGDKEVVLINIDCLQIVEGETDQ